MQIENKPFRDILIVFKEGLATVTLKEELLDGFSLLLDRFPELCITEEDEAELDKILGGKKITKNREVLGFSECKKYALVKLSAEQQKKLKSSLAIIPLRNNPDLENSKTDTVYSFQKLLSMSNYTYHP